MYENIGVRLKAMRETAGYTQSVLAALLNEVSGTHDYDTVKVARIESGKRGVQLRDLGAYSEVLGLSSGAILDDLDQAETGFESDDVYPATWGHVMLEVLSQPIDSKLRMLRSEREFHLERVAQIDREIEGLNDYEFWAHRPTGWPSATLGRKFPAPPPPLPDEESGEKRQQRSSGRPPKKGS